VLDKIRLTSSGDLKGRLMRI